VSELLPFIISGIATGAVYSLAGTGLVLTYKTSGIFNFGHGAIATVAAYLFYFLHVERGISWVPAFAVAVFVAGPLMGLVMDRIGHRLAPQPMALKIVGTVGLVLIVQGLATIKYGSDTILVSQYLPKASESFEVAGVNVLWPQVWVTLIGVLATVALYVLFRWTRTGLAMRAVVDDPDLVAMQATNPNAIRRRSWIIGSTFAAASGALVLPFIGLNAIALTYLVVQAFGAAAIGAFTSILLTFVGGLVIGIGSSLATKYAVDVPWLTGLPASLPFIVLFAALLLLPKRKLVPPTEVEQKPRREWHPPGRVTLAGAAVLLVVLVLVPQLVTAKQLGFYVIAVSQMILLLSLGLLVKGSGQVSLAQAALSAIGAVAFSQLAVGAGLPWLIALLLGSLVAVAVGILVAVPAIRLSGLFLALATFGLGIMVENLFYQREFMFTVLNSGRPMPRPSFASGDEAFYYVLLALLVCVAIAMILMNRSRLGRMLRGMADAPVAIATLGLSLNTARIIVFSFSAFLAGMAGILYGASVNFAVPTDAHFMSFYSLTLFALLVISPLGTPWYALFAGISAVIPAYLSGDNTPYWLNVLFGAFAVLVAVQGGTHPMPDRLRNLLDRIGGRQEPAFAGVPAAPAARSIPNGQPVEAEAKGRREVRLSSGLEVRSLTVRFGGLVAVDDFSFEVPLGQITGLIGPNGAGKTTTFDACCGLNRRIEGQVILDGKDVTRLGPAARGRMGLGRTFQRMQLADTLTVAENVALGREAGMAGRGALSMLRATRSQRRTVEAASEEALALCEITDLADEPVGFLSTGQRRRVELARCLAGPFDILLLDEPSSGLDRNETLAFDAVLRSVVEERGCGILLVEHDMSLVMSICTEIYVLDFGRLIFKGERDEVAASSEVQKAYLGTEALEVETSGERV
jgi:ABC-type branched-subunit amino acid transport system ATPase component/branched-subunit amino acid ABC-type transport system permease component